MHWLSLPSEDAVWAEENMPERAGEVAAALADTRKPVPLALFMRCGSGVGYGDGSAYGDGYGDGSAYGDGDGSAYGYGYGIGIAYGDGYGSAYGDGYGSGYGEETR